MNANEFMSKVIADDVRPQIEALGLSDFALDNQIQNLSVPAAAHVIKPRVEVALTTLQTVAELRTVSKLLHSSQLADAGERLVGGGFYLATAPTLKPIAFVKDDAAVGVLMDMARLTEAIKELPAARPVDDPHWLDQDYNKLIRLGEAFRVIREEYDIAVTERPKRGPEPRTMEEVIDIINDWKHWQALDYTQQMYCDFKGWGSRTILSKCIARYRQAFGQNSI